MRDVRRPPKPPSTPRMLHSSSSLDPFQTVCAAPVRYVRYAPHPHPHAVTALMHHTVPYHGTCPRSEPQAHAYQQPLHLSPVASRHSRRHRPQAACHAAQGVNPGDHRQPPEMSRHTQRWLLLAVYSTTVHNRGPSTALWGGAHAHTTLSPSGARGASWPSRLCEGILSQPLVACCRPAASTFNAQQHIHVESTHCTQPMPRLSTRPASVPSQPPTRPTTLANGAVVPPITPPSIPASTTM
jgi:hypothetical protein